MYASQLSLDLREVHRFQGSVSLRPISPLVVVVCRPSTGEQEVPRRGSFPRSLQSCVAGSQAGWSPAAQLLQPRWDGWLRLSTIDIAGACLPDARMPGVVKVMEGTEARNILKSGFSFIKLNDNPRGLRKKLSSVRSSGWSCDRFSAPKDHEKDIAASVDRTRDLQIFSLTLSQLSYRGFNT